MYSWLYYLPSFGYYMCPYEHTLVLFVHDRIVTIVVFLLFSAKAVRTFSDVSVNNPVPTSFSNAESEVSVFTFAFQMYPIMSNHTMSNL